MIARRAFLSAFTTAITTKSQASSHTDLETNSARRMIEPYVFRMLSENNGSQGSSVLLDPDGGWLALTTHQADFQSIIRIRGTLSMDTLHVDRPYIRAKIIYASQPDSANSTHDIALAKVEAEDMPLLAEHLARYPHRRPLAFSHLTPEGITRHKLMAAGYPLSTNILTTAILNPRSISHQNPTNNIHNIACTVSGPSTLPEYIPSGISGGGVFEITGNNRQPVLTGIITTYFDYSRHLGFAPISTFAPYSDDWA